MKDWHEAFPFLTDSLQHAKMAGRLGHSFLVVSSNPDNRLEFPLYLAMLASCTEPQFDGSPCGSCSSCKQLKNGLYPDLFLLSPTSKSRMILVGDTDDDPDTLRNFQHNFYLGSTTESGWKIGIIQDCDTMNENAQNAFLKTLEEPPEKCLFILTTGRPGALLPTIRSRCQILTLTDNHCSYDFSCFPSLPATLKKLACDAANDLVTAEDCAKELIDILDSLDDRAKETITEKWTPRMEAAKQLESAGIKLLEKRRDGEIGCEYRRLREQFTSILHAFFAQLALLAGGMKQKILPNPEIMEAYFLSPTEVKEREALRMLTLAEKLTDTLRTNVNDALALRTFALSVAIKK